MTKSIDLPCRRKQPVEGVTMFSKRRCMTSLAALVQPTRGVMMISAIRTSVLAAVATGVILISASGAKAFPVTWSFAVFATNGPLAGTSAIGAFSVDSSLIETSLASLGYFDGVVSMNFSWNGVAYTQGTADLSFPGSSFSVDRAAFGASDGPGNSWAALYDPGAGPDQTYFTYFLPGFVPPPPSLNFTAALAFNSSPFCVNNPFCLVPAPEPASFSLLAMGLAGLGLVLRTRRV